MSLRLSFFMVVVLFASSYSAVAQSPFSAVGVGVKISPLGPGVEVATPLGYGFNVRGGFNMFTYGRSFTNNGVSYDAQLQLRSAELHLDWFPFRGAFHLSPGALIYDGNQLTANASVPASTTFTVNHVTYESDPADPVTGTPKLDFMKAAPMITAGWGNLVPRTKHISVPFEFGLVFQGSPRVALNLAGSICNTDGTNCRAISSDSTVQSNIQAQQNKYSSDVSVLKVYPIISIGVGYKF
jgi:hypothetical protein